MKHHEMSEVKKLFKSYFSMRRTEHSFHMDLFVMFLILIITAIFVLRTYEIPLGFEIVISYLEPLILGLFTVEFCLRYFYAESKKEFFTSIYTWIDFIAIFPFWFGETSFQFLRILRFFRILRYSEKYLNFKHFLDNKGFQKIFLMRLIFSILSLIFIASSMIYVHESSANPFINTFDDAIYFSVVTITTVGYGDIVPVTSWGKWTIMLVVLIFAILIPWHISTLIRFSSHSNQKVELDCKKCKLSLHDPDATYCRICGTQLVKRSLHDGSYDNFRKV